MSIFGITSLKEQLAGKFSEDGDSELGITNVTRISSSRTSKKLLEAFSITSRDVRVISRYSSLIRLMFYISGMLVVWSAVRFADPDLDLEWKVLGLVIALFALVCQRMTANWLFRQTICYDFKLQNRRFLKADVRTPSSDTARSVVFDLTKDSVFIEKTSDAKGFFVYFVKEDDPFTWIDYLNPPQVKSLKSFFSRLL